MLDENPKPKRGGYRKNAGRPKTGRCHDAPLLSGTDREEKEAVTCILITTGRNSPAPLQLPRAVLTVAT